MSEAGVSKVLDINLVNKLRLGTNRTHDRLDNRIMAAEIFSSVERYGSFLRMQYLFHREIDVLYTNSELQNMLPDLKARQRLDLIKLDLEDLGHAVPDNARPPAFSEQVDIPAALGWLYVAEGSNLGAAVLLKLAIKLGLSETHGARHLAGHPDGRGLHWRLFTAAMNSISLTPAEEARVIAGGESAFNHVHNLVAEL